MQLDQKLQRGFTLVEMIVVIVISGILGGMIVMLVRGPVQSYLDSAQRADMGDIANAVMHRFTHDVRLALPHSVRVWGATSGSGSCNGTETCYLEYLEMVAGGRYNTDTSSCFSTASMVSGGVSCLTTMGDLVGGAAGSASNVLANGRGTIWASPVSAVVVVNNLYNNSGNNCATSSVYCGDGRANITNGLVTNSGVNADEDVIAFPTTLFVPSPNNRFQVVNTPVSYVCDPVAGTLTRYWNYAIQPNQPSSTLISPLSAASHALVGTNVSNCRFAIASVTDASGQSAVLASMLLIISEQGADQAQGDKLTLYGAAYAGSEAALYGGANGSLP